MKNEYDDWFAAWGETIATEPGRKCHCGGTFSRHRMACPCAPPYGYDRDGKPFTESQLPRVMQELGRRAAARVNEVILNGWLHQEPTA